MPVEGGIVSSQVVGSELIEILTWSGERVRVKEEFRKKKCISEQANGL